MSAVNILEKAAGHLKDRAATYDIPGGERSIGATVRAFNAITGDGMMNSGERGWLFMAVLKMVRSQQGNYKTDNYEDLAAYSALMGEAACEERNGGWTPEAINGDAFKHRNRAPILQSGRKRRGSVAGCGAKKSPGRRRATGGNGIKGP